MISVGLTSGQAEKLLVKYGQNELPSKQSYSIFKIFYSQISNALSILLFGAALLSFFVGDQTDGFLIILILSLNTALGFWQEYKASKELEALRKLEVLNARVIRDNHEQQIPAKELVPGDIIILEAGDKVPADAKLIESMELTVNEAALTGESLAVVKTTDEENSTIYFGTGVSSGRGKAEVISTGKDTRFGKIALTLSSVTEEQTPLEIALNSLGKKIGFLAVVIAISIFFIRLIQGWNVTEVFFTSIALMVAAVPEGLPAIITIALAFGVHRMYKKKALVRRMSAIESLGAATVICTDKTGTLTRNEMRVKEVLAEEKVEKLLLDTAIYCNSASLVIKEDENDFDILGDTTEGALLIWAKEKGVDIETKRKEGRLLHEIPFSLQRRMMSTVWENNQKAAIYTKGAPEVVLSLCGLTNNQIEKLTKDYQKLALRGLRVLALAYKDLNKIKNKNDFKEDNLTFLGFVGIADAAREEAKEAIKKAKNAGISVVMITGDNELTAKVIGEEVGLLASGDEIITGSQLDELDEEALLERLDKIKIFARVVPEHKLRIVQAFQKKGEVVAVTGDGVNDALALKQAEVGIAMGKTGTDVAKEASDIIVLDDNFATIVIAVEEGRLIYNNILKVVKFLLTGNLSEVLVIVSSVIFGFPTPLLPVQILWVNFVTDGLPALALVADPASKRIMNTSPQRHADTLLTAGTYKLIFIGGLAIAGITLAAFMFALNIFGLEVARSYAFTVLVVSQMIFVFVMRRDHSIFSNRYLFVSVALVLIIQVLILTVPMLQSIFKIR